MIANRNYEQCQPITWVGRLPVYLSTMLAVAMVAGMIVTSLFEMFGLGVWFERTFSFSVAYAIYDFKLWQFVTYPFVIGPNIWVALQIVFFAMFAREVEKYIGRNSFAWLFGLLVVTIPVFLTALFFGGFPPTLYHGPSLVLFAVFIAFVLLYPSAEIFFSIQARWFGIAFVGIFSLQMMAVRNWPDLSMFWLECLVAALWLAHEGFNPLRLPTLPAMPSISNLWRRRRSRRHLRVMPPVEENVSEPEESVHDSIDPILEKIARRGIGSLTRAEREKLEKARTALLEKERSN